LKVVWTRLALEDLENAYEFISYYSPEAAKEIISRVEGGINNLRQYPNVGKKGRLKGTRELVIPNTPFFLPYRVKETHIEILAFLHGRRKWPSPLE